MEDCWPTKSPWFRLVTTIIGMSVVDLHRWDRNKRSNGKAFDWINADDERPDFLKVRTMANLIASGLKKPQMRYYKEGNPRQTVPNKKRRMISRHAECKLTRITNKEGSIRRPNGKKKEYQKTCYICRQYKKKPVNTVWWCIRCEMPLCKRSRRREMTCVEEHEAYQDDPHLGCHANREYFVMPPGYRLFPQVSTSTGRNHDNNDDVDSSDDEYFECDGDRRQDDNNEDNADSSDDEYLDSNYDAESTRIDSNKSLLETFDGRNSSNNSRELRDADDNGRQHKGRERSGRGSGISQGIITRSTNVVHRTTTRSAAMAAAAKQDKRKSG